MAYFFLAAAAGGATGAAGDEASKPFFAFDPTYFASQLFWLTVLFGLLYFVLSRFILPKLGGVIEKRVDTIANDLDEAARMSDQAAEAEQALELRIATARANARETADKARAKFDQEMADASAATDEELATKLAVAETRISEMRTKAMSNVSAIATDATTMLTEKFGLNIDAAAAKSAVADVMKS